MGETELSTFGARLAHALELSGKERRELAAALTDEAADRKISVQAIGQVIRGESGAMAAENAVRSARFLGVDPFWLVTGEGDPTALVLSPAERALVFAFRQQQRPPPTPPPGAAVLPLPSKPTPPRPPKALLLTDPQKRRAAKKKEK